MPHTRYSSAEIVRRGQELYERKVRSLVEPTHHGQFLVLDIETEEYEIDQDKLNAYERAVAKHDNPALYILRVGYPSAVKLGGKFRVQHP